MENNTISPTLTPEQLPKIQTNYSPNTNNAVSTDSSNTYTDSSSTESSQSIPVPAKVMIKNTFITLNSVNPSNPTRNRTFSSDAILFGNRLNRPPEYFTYNNSPSLENSHNEKPLHPLFPSQEISTKNTDFEHDDNNSTQLVNSIINLDSNHSLSSYNTNENEKNAFSFYSNASISNNQIASHLDKILPSLQQRSSHNLRFNDSVGQRSSNMNDSAHLIKDTLGMYDITGQSSLPTNSLFSSNQKFDDKNLNNFNQLNDMPESDTFGLQSQKNDYHNLDPSLLLNVVRDSSLLVSDPGLVAKEIALNKSDLSELPQCNNGYTTLMLRNIPNKYTQNMLLDVINEDFHTLYDFFYLPIDFRNKCNVGYAFINLIHPYLAELFCQKFINYKLTTFKSNKICTVTWGRVQGLQANIEHYRNSAVMTLSSAQYKPMLFQNGAEIPFPSSNRPVSEVKLRGKK